MNKDVSLISNRLISTLWSSIVMISSVTISRKSKKFITHNNKILPRGFAIYCI